MARQIEDICEAHGGIPPNKVVTDSATCLGCAPMRHRDFGDVESGSVSPAEEARRMQWTPPRSGAFANEKDLALFRELQVGFLFRVCFDPEDPGVAGCLSSPRCLRLIFLSAHLSPQSDLSGILDQRDRDFEEERSKSRAIAEANPISFAQRNSWTRDVPAALYRSKQALSVVDGSACSRALGPSPISPRFEQTNLSFHRHGEGPGIPLLPCLATQ